MKILGITEAGSAFHATAVDVERVIGSTPITTDIAGVYCWSEGSGAVNETATTYLRSKTLFSPDQYVRGVALFGAVGSGGEPLDINECALAALGWSIARSLIAAIEVDLLAPVA